MLRTKLTDWKGVNHSIRDVRNEKIKSFSIRSCNLSLTIAFIYLFFYKALFQIQFKNEEVIFPSLPLGVNFILNVFLSVYNIGRDTHFSHFVEKCSNYLGKRAGGREGNVFHPSCWSCVTMQKRSQDSMRWGRESKRKIERAVLYLTYSFWYRES